MSSAIADISGTIQAGHIRRHPDPRHDLAPSTAADTKEVISLHSAGYSSDCGGGESPYDADADADADIPYSVLRPPRQPRYSFPPLPDLRFEQSYLHSIAHADTWWKVALITLRDQVLMPLTQGLLMNLALVGWQHWNRNARLHGNSVGSRVRRWWYGVNNWKIPNTKRA
ncbi:Uncharacterized protein ESCO_000706 [Escovopsis weberi]|uniref:DUF1770-domain-containing protein n=1 Tax=Escovopsis weberi TaxID=150374 RepID=A0A0N0RTE1_ESCWE|nr:Uncharacterized protein ESCO_000706 [Escovopsis weberi]